MSRIILLICLFISISNAIYLEASFQDSRMQWDNHIYNPGGILGYTLHVGFFNEPENILDFKTGFELKKFGYSHKFKGNEKSTALWSIGLRPLIVSVSYWNVVFETYGSLSYIFANKNITPYMKEKLYRRDKPDSYTCGYGYKLGYRFKKDFETGITANYSLLNWRLPSQKDDSEGQLIGGFGLYFSWNVW